jgi:hypothetical protein
MRKSKPRSSTNARSNFDRRGLLKDGRSYRSRSGGLDLKTVRKFGKHLSRSPFGKFIDSFQPK